jgi:uncharacterized membrane protein YGL010W
MGIAAYFDLHQAFPFYAAYHDNKMNQLLHLFGIPAIFMTALTFASFVPIGGGFSFADLAAVCYAVSFTVMDAVAGGSYAVVIYGMHHVGTNVLTNHIELAVLLHVVAWVVQFIGHGVFEGRKPALFDSFGQSIHAAVFFVWLELLFFLGYKPALHAALQAKMRKVKKALPQ